MSSYFCFYPHCVITTNESTVFVVDTINKDSILCQDKEIVDSINNLDSYLFYINKSNASFFSEACTKNLGYIIDGCHKSPYLSSPKISFTSSMEKEKRALGFNTGWNISSFINCFVIYLNNTSFIAQRECVYEQIGYPKFRIKPSIVLTDVIQCINDVIDNSAIETIYICGDIDDVMISIINHITGKVSCIIVRTYIDEISNCQIKLIHNECINYDIIIDNYEKIKNKDFDISEEDYSISCLIYNEDDVDDYQNLSCNHRYIPIIFDKKSQRKLLNQMMISYDDIIQATNSVEECLVKNQINNSIFGRVILDISGDIYIEEELIGNINSDTIYSILTKYLQVKHNRWLLTRENYEICKDCLLRSLCPNITIYERQGFLLTACDKETRLKYNIL